MLKAIATIWPNDVGTSLEASDFEIDFLTVLIHSSADGSYFITPLPTKNINFARRLDPYPAVSRIAPYKGLSIHGFNDIKLLLFPHILSFNRISLGFIVPAARCTTLLLAEVFLLGRPTLLVANVLSSIPRRHEAIFILSLRRLSKYFRHNFRYKDPSSITFEVIRSFFNNDIHSIASSTPHIIQLDPVLCSTQL